MKYEVTIMRNADYTTRSIMIEALNRKHAEIKANAKRGYGEIVTSVKTALEGQEKTDRENREHCKRIAEDVEDYALGRVYRCPDCHELLTLPDDEGEKYRCPDCGTVHDIGDLEQQSIWDYTEDALDIKFVVSSRREVESVKIMIACGGPNIYINTDTGYVELYWWGDRASYPLCSEAIEELDNWAAEYWGCMG
jgi:DNA-directed RNA polymerase subunit RPC12/RpoP